MTASDGRELDDLVAAVCHGTATEAQMRDLSARLAADPGARAAYLRQVDVHAALAADDALFGLPSDGASDGGGFPLPLPIRGGKPPALPQRLAGSPALLASAVILLAALTAVALVLRPWQRRETATGLPIGDAEVGEGASAVDALATITRSVDARWRGSEPPAVLAEPRLLELASGLAQIECGAGAVLVAEGPFKAEILSDAALRLEHGKVRVSVPPQASGFTLYTPEMKVIDHGTDFAVFLEADGPGEIHVFEGEIEIVPEGGKRNETQRLLAGEARAFDFRRDGHRLVPRPVNPAAFLGIREIDARSRALREQQRTAWRARVVALATDPALRVLFTFDDHESWERTVRNLAPAGRPATNGALIGCQWTRGRWPEKAALDFHRPADRVRLHLGATADAFTLMAWVYLPADAAPRPRTLFSAQTGGRLKGLAPEWQLTRDGGMTLSLRGQTGDKSLVFRQDTLYPSAFRAGWHHLAATYSLDPASGLATAHFYLDGRSVLGKTLQDGAPAAFARCDLGNSVPPPPRDGDTPGPRGQKAARRATEPFVGLIDEFALLTRALAPEEIEAHWRAGAQVPVPE